MRQIFFVLVLTLLLMQGLSHWLESGREQPNKIVPASIWDGALTQAKKSMPATIAHRGPPDGSLVVLPEKHRVSSDQLRQLLAGDAHQAQFFVYKLYGTQSANASALGLDQEHHWVNAYLEGYQPFETHNVFVPLAVLARKKAYQLDKLNHGAEEMWQTSEQAYWFARGDCEDHAIALADWLISMGEDARVVLGRYKSGGHAWVVLIKNNQEFLLEATQKHGVNGLKRYPLAALQHNYEPQFQFNRERFWAYEGSGRARQYRGTQWREKSRFVRP